MLTVFRKSDTFETCLEARYVYDWPDPVPHTGFLRYLSRHRTVKNHFLNFAFLIRGMCAHFETAMLGFFIPACAEWMFALPIWAFWKIPAFQQNLYFVLLLCRHLIGILFVLCRNSFSRQDKKNSVFALLNKFINHIPRSKNSWIVVGSTKVWRRCKYLLTGIIHLLSSSVKQ